MSKAVIIAWPHVLGTPLVQSIIELSGTFDIYFEKIEITKQTTPPDLFITMCRYKNVISWVNHGFSFEVQSKNRNMLYLENGLLTRGKTFFFDDNGYGNYSNIVSRKDNCRQYSPQITELVVKKLTDFGFCFKKDNNNSKKIVIGLQGTSGDEDLLKTCIKYLPRDSTVVVRPHPGQLDRCKTAYDTLECEKAGYAWDSIECPFESISLCEALIVNNSALMFKGLAMGKKVATCNRGIHSGSTAVLDCSRNLPLLRKIFDFIPNYDATLNLLCGIELNMISREATPHDLLQNTNFVNWLTRYKR